MEDPQIHGTIEQLVAEEHELGPRVGRERERSRPATLARAQGLARAALGPAAPTPRPPGCRARPEAAALRQAQVVERYQQ